MSRVIVADLWPSIRCNARTFTPAHVVDGRRLWANTILGLIGQEQPDDFEMMALESLARAALAICDSPQDIEVIGRFEEAGTAFLEIRPPRSSM